MPQLAPDSIACGVGASPFLSDASRAMNATLPTSAGWADSVNDSSTATGISLLIPSPSPPLFSSTNLIQCFSAGLPHS